MPTTTRRRPDERAGWMTADNIAGLALAVSLLAGAYLVAALLYPERF